MEESALVEQAQQGDTGAYEELVRRYQELAMRTAYLITGDQSEAEDIVQEAFIKAYHALARFRHEAPFRPWLLRIVVNEARNRRRTEGRRMSLTLRVAQGQPPPASVPSPEATLLAVEQQRLLLHAVEGLREDDRLVIAYRYFLDLSEAEMAVTLNCARGTVKSRLARALKRLRAQLPEEIGDRSAGMSAEKEGVRG